MTDAPDDVAKLLDGWEELARLVDKPDRTWREHCVVGAGRHMEIKTVLPYIRTLEKEHRAMRRHLEDTPTTDDDLVEKTGKLLDSITLRP